MLGIYPLWEGFIGHLWKGGHISVVCGRLGIYQLWEGFICWAYISVVGGWAMGIYHQKPNIRHLSALASYFSCSCCDIKQTDCYPSSDCGGFCIMSQNSLIMMKYTGMTAPPLPDELQTRSNEQCNAQGLLCLPIVWTMLKLTVWLDALPCHCQDAPAMALPLQLPRCPDIANAIDKIFITPGWPLPLPVLLPFPMPLPRCSKLDHFLAMAIISLAHGCEARLCQRKW